MVKNIKFELLIILNEIAPKTAVLRSLYTMKKNSCKFSVIDIDQCTVYSTYTVKGKYKNLFFFYSYLGSDLVIRVDRPTLSSATIIGIAVGGVILLVVLLDLICCTTLRMGVTASLCRRTKRSPSDLDDETKIGR